MIIVDVEATGTDPHKHSIVSIGAINFDDPSKYFYEECMIWDGAHVEKSALEINGFTEEEFTDITKKTEGELVAAFIEWAMAQEEHTFGGINPLFDIGFIKAAAHRAKINYPFAERSIDLHTLIYFYHLKAGEPVPTFNGHTAINADYIMNFVGIPAEPRPHNALNGALWETEALYRLVYGESCFDHFTKYPVPFN